MKSLARALMVALAAVFAAPLQAQVDPRGPYALVALGSSKYDYDCYFFSSCDSARSTVFKLGGGYRFGVFAIEGWLMDFGGANLPWGDSLRVRGFGLGGAWVMRFSPTVHGLLRTGLAQVRQTRTRDVDSSGVEPTFGLALLIDATPTAAVELAWDITTATGENSGSVLAQGFTIGLRLRF